MYTLVERIPMDNGFFCGGLYKDEQGLLWFVKFISKDFYKYGYYNGLRNIQCQVWGKVKDIVAGAIIIDTVGHLCFIITTEKMKEFGQPNNLVGGHKRFDGLDYHASIDKWDTFKYNPEDFKETVCA